MKYFLSMLVVLSMFTASVNAAPTGATGATGASGAAGQTGKTGASGTNGSNGAAGVSGATGSTGAAGSNGSAGLVGASGSTGATGNNGVAGSNGAVGATGQSGTNGSNGSNGSNGTNGAVGATGASGYTSSLTVVALTTGQGYTIPGPGTYLIGKDLMEYIIVNLPATPAFGDVVTVKENSRYIDGDGMPKSFVDVDGFTAGFELTTAGYAQLIDGSQRVIDYGPQASNSFIYDGTGWRRVGQSL